MYDLYSIITMTVTCTFARHGGYSPEKTKSIHPNKPYVMPLIVIPRILAKFWQAYPQKLEQFLGQQNDTTSVFRYSARLSQMEIYFNDSLDGTLQCVEKYKSCDSNKYISYRQGIFSDSRCLAPLLVSELRTQLLFKTEINNTNVSRDFLVFQNKLCTMNIRAETHAVQPHATWINGWQSITY